MSSILITGANGFVGGHLLNALFKDYKAKYTIYAGYLGNIDTEFKHDTVNWLELDISQRDNVYNVIETIRPDYVLHLAAISHIPSAGSALEKTWQVNVMGSLYLLEAIQALAPDCNFLFVSSSEVYGDSFKQQPELSEQACLQPKNVYASSKAAIDLLCGQLAQEGRNIIRVRPFNHIGPGQSEDFVVPAFASQIARIESGKQEPTLKVGNLTAIRDFLDVRDVVDAYIQIIESFHRIGTGSVLNISSGKGYSIQQLLDILIENTESKIKIEQEKSRMRPVEIATATGNAMKLKELTGWEPKITIEETIVDVLNEWRTIVR